MASLAEETSPLQRIQDTFEQKAVKHSEFEDQLNSVMKAEIFENLNRLRDLLADAIGKASKYGVQVTTTPTRRQSLILSLGGKKELDGMLVKAQEWQSEMLTRLAVISVSHPGLLTELFTFLQGSPLPRNHANEPVPQIPDSEVRLRTQPPTDLRRLRYSSVFRSPSQPNIFRRRSLPPTWAKA